jgi:hypothetical protein
MPRGRLLPEARSERCQLFSFSLVLSSVRVAYYYQSTIIVYLSGRSGPLVGRVRRCWLGVSRSSLPTVDYELETPALKRVLVAVRFVAMDSERRPQVSIPIACRFGALRFYPSCQVPDPIEYSRV